MNGSDLKSLEPLFQELDDILDKDTRYDNKNGIKFEYISKYGALRILMNRVASIEEIKDAIINFIAEIMVESERS